MPTENRPKNHQAQKIFYRQTDSAFFWHLPFRTLKLWTIYFFSEKKYPWFGTDVFDIRKVFLFGNFLSFPLH